VVRRETRCPFLAFGAGLLWVCNFWFWNKGALSVVYIALCLLANQAYVVPHAKDYDARRCRRFFLYA